MAVQKKSCEIFYIDFSSFELFILTYTKKQVVVEEKKLKKCLYLCGDFLLLGMKIGIYIYELPSADIFIR